MLHHPHSTAPIFPTRESTYHFNERSTISLKFSALDTLQKVEKLFKGFHPSLSEENRTPNLKER
jgi:hypothetical protein